MKPSWYDPLRTIRSLGSQKEKIAHMGELAEQRRKHLGQFFTPDFVAAFMWRFVDHLDFRSILDNSIGSARLLQFADPEKHSLFGVDVHKETVERVKEVATAAGFTCEIECAGMQDIRPRHIDIALINPPFSIHLESPHLRKYSGCTRMGRFGPDTSATSDEYAVRQALDAAKVVIALVPKSTADAMYREMNAEINSRLRAVFDLPSDTFMEEGANVLTSVVVFSDFSHHGRCRISVSNLDQPLPNLGLENAIARSSGTAELRLQGLDHVKPTISLPVTGDPSVRISIDGRKIRLGFTCGFTQARVKNAVLNKRIFSSEHWRLPKGVGYAGQGKLDLEVYLAQQDPGAAFDGLLRIIRDNGGAPVLQPGVMETISNKTRRSRLQATPLRHTVWSRGTGSAAVITGVSRKTHNVDVTKWISPVIKQGEAVEFRRQPSGTYSYEKKGNVYSISADDLESRFALQGVTEGWHVVHEGLRMQYPEHAELLRKRALKLGIDRWLSWDFQLDDVIELTMKPYGGIAAWKQACGKSRLAAALILLSGVKHGLMVLESRLIEEMVGQLEKASIDMSTVNIIDCVEKLDCLKQINLISYERLRMPVDDTNPKGKNIYAKRLRRRIGLVVADEGEKLANFTSDQSRALRQLSAKKRYILTGTPVANYSRDVHGLLLFVSGDGTAAQPYGYYRGYLEGEMINSMEFCKRGIDAVRDDYVVVEWVSWEFAETLRDGAKREIPKIANVEKFRAWLAPHIKRRILEEPDVAKFIKLPPLEHETITVDWDERHLGFYLKVADEFAHWYRQAKDERKNNLAMLLAKLQAVQKALNCPQDFRDGDFRYGGLTSKQEAVLEKLIEIADGGNKALLFCENPTVVKTLHRELKLRGIKSVQFHGGISIKKRVVDKDKYFRFGSTPHLLATKGTAKSGFNLPEADYVVFYDQSWSWRIMDQAMRRPLRPERKLPVKVINFLLPGSLDEYQVQMVAFKKDSADAGLDWATPELDDAEYLHMGTILQRFVDDLAMFSGANAHEMRERLKQAA